MTDQTKHDPKMAVQAMRSFGLDPKNDKDVKEFLTALNNQEPRMTRRSLSMRYRAAAQITKGNQKKLGEVDNLGKDAGKLKGHDLLAIGLTEALPSMGKPDHGPIIRGIDHLHSAYDTE